MTALDFAVIMLATTTAGDTYTAAEYRRMLGVTSLTTTEVHDVAGIGTRVIVARRP